MPTRRTLFGSKHDLQDDISANPAGMNSMEPSNGQCILLIDDEAEFVQMLARLLAKIGFAPLVASSGQEGIALAAQKAPDLILCDLEMPAMHGHAVLDALQHDTKLAEIPVIFLTGRSVPEDVRRGMNLGADDYLTKPVSPGNLFQAIQSRLQRRQREKERLKHQTERSLHLFAGAVQDLRDPLFVISGGADLLQPGENQAGPGELNAPWILDRMQRAAASMEGTLSEILFAAKSRMQQLPFDPGPLDLREFCERLVAERDHRHRLRFKCAPGSYLMTADALRLRQALEGLLSNACKYSDGIVTLRLASRSGRYEIEITDTGIGIPVAEQARVFEPFFRGANAVGKSGHGLGLCVARSCIHQHGGTIHFTSQPDPVTKFVIALPMVPLIPLDRHPAGSLARFTASDPNLSIPEPKPPMPGPGASLWRGIIVDDDPLVRGVLRDLVAQSGDITIVGEAGDIRQARVIVRQHQPAVVFLDATLPDGPGFDLLPDLKPATSVVFVTSAEDYATKAFDCEATDYLLKPINPERLKKALLRVRQRLAGQSATAAPADSRLTGSFLIKVSKAKQLVRFDQIKSITAFGEYTRIHWHENSEGAMIRKSLKKWACELPAAQFIRVHRKAIVNLAFLHRVERLLGRSTQIHLRDMPEPVLVSLKQTPVFNRKLRAWQRISPGRD